jgi:hypothetical protein
MHRRRGSSAAVAVVALKLELLTKQGLARRNADADASCSGRAAAETDFMLPNRTRETDAHVKNIVKERIQSRW